MPTIAEDIKVWKKTKGKMNTDYLNLLSKFIDYSRKNRDKLVIKSPDYSDTTFHELRVPMTIDQAKERYKKDRTKAISPSFKDLVKKVEDYNGSCISSGGYKKKIKEIELTDFMNFLYFSDRALNILPNYQRIKKKDVFKRGILRKKKISEKQIEVEDPEPIIVFTNPKKDGLLDFFKGDLIRAMKKGRGLKIGLYGENYNRDDLKCFDSFKDFEFMNIKFVNPEDEYFGIFTRYDFVKGKFQGKSEKPPEPGLFGFANRIKGEFVLDSKLDYEVTLNRFNELKMKKQNKYTEYTIKNIKKDKEKAEINFCENNAPLTLSIDLSEKAVNKNLVEKLNTKDILQAEERIDNKSIESVFPNPINKLFLVGSQNPGLKAELQVHKKFLISDLVPYYLV